MITTNVKEKLPLELDSKKELERQLKAFKESNFKEVNPVKFASRIAELEAKLAKLK